MHTLILLSVTYIIIISLSYASSDHHQYSIYETNITIGHDQNNKTTSNEGKCEIPKRLIVEPTDTSEQYVPRGTNLYRCGNDIGCCNDYYYNCVAVEIEAIDIEFLLEANAIRKTRKRVQTYRCFHHTRCACRRAPVQQQTPCKLASTRNFKPNDDDVNRESSTTTQNTAPPVAADLYLSTSAPMFTPSLSDSPTETANIKMKSFVLIVITISMAILAIAMVALYYKKYQQYKRVVDRNQIV